MGQTKEQKANRQLEQNNYRELPQPDCCYNCKNSTRDYDGDFYCELVISSSCVSPFGYCDKYERED